MTNPIGNMRVNLGINSAEFDAGIKKAQGSLAGIGKVFSGLAAAGVFAGFSAGIGQAVGRIENMRKLSAQLDRALANVGNTAQTSASEVEEFARRLEHSTGRAAEEVLAVSTNLATFGFSRETFYEAITLADDMAAAWGGDLKSNMEGLARALDDPEKGLAMLTKRGITFTEQQKAMIASFMQANDVIGAQGVIFDALNAQVKGVAEAGFGGLTKASANLRRAFEGMFEGIAGGMQINWGLEQSLVAITLAVDMVTANLDTIGKAATVAGAALVTALGPAVWAATSAAAVSTGTAVVAAIRAIGVAIASNPIGFIVTALAAAVAAAFAFRDEIKQAIGIDFVGIIKDAANFVIGAFVAAFENVKTYWSQLPAAIGDITIQTANALIAGIEDMLNGVSRAINGWLDEVAEKTHGIINLGRIEGEVQFGRIENPWADRAAEMGAEIARNVSEALSVDYLGGIGEMLSGLFGGGEGASPIAPLVSGIKDDLADLDGALQSGKDVWKDYADTVNSSMVDMAASVAGSLGNVMSGLSSAFQDNKVLAIATAVLKGTEAIASAFASGMAAGGLPLASAQAGIAAITAAANVAAVARVGPGSSTMSAPATSAAVQTPGPAQDEGPQRVVNVTLQGHSYGRAEIVELMRQIDEQMGNGVRFRYIRMNDY